MMSAKTNHEQENAETRGHPPPPILAAAIIADFILQFATATLRFLSIALFKSKICI